VNAPHLLPAAAAAGCSACQAARLQAVTAARLSPSARALPATSLLGNETLQVSRSLCTRLSWCVKRCALYADGATVCLRRLYVCHPACHRLACRGCVETTAGQRVTGPPLGAVCLTRHHPQEEATRTSRAPGSATRLCTMRSHRQSHASTMRVQHINAGASSDR